jgi:hypothetical protein
MPKTEFTLTRNGEPIATTKVESKTVKCDFCSRPVGETCFIARDARMLVEPEPGDINPLNLKEVRLESDAHWAACDPCAKLIRANSRHGVFERSAAAGAIFGLDRELLQAIQATLFWACWSGLSHPAADHPEHPRHGEGGI